MSPVAAKEQGAGSVKTPAGSRFWAPAPLTPGYWPWPAMIRKNIRGLPLGWEWNGSPCYVMGFRIFAIFMRTITAFWRSFRVSLSAAVDRRRNRISSGRKRFRLWLRFYISMDKNFYISLNKEAGEDASSLQLVA